MKWIDDIKKYYVFRILIKRFALPVIVLFMVDSGLSLQQIAVITAATAVLGLVLEVPSGAIADSIGHKRALVYSMIGQGLSMVLYLGGGFYWILAASLLYWGAGTLMTGTMDALFYERLQVLGRAREYKSLTGKATSVAQFFGIGFMALAGALYMIHPWVPFIIGVAQFFIGAVLISSFGETRKGKVEKFEAAMVWQNIVEASSLMKKHKDIFWIIISYAVIVGSSYILFDYEQVVMKDFGVLAAGIGLAYSGKRLIGALSLLTIPVLDKWVSDKKAIVWGMIIIALIFVMASVAPSIIIFLVGIYLMTGVTLVVKVVALGYANEQVETDARATLLSFNSLIMGLVKASGVLVLGAMLDFLDLQIALGLIAAATCLIALLLFVPGMVRTIK